MPVPGEQPHAGTVTSRHDAEAVVLDFVQPIRPGRRSLGGRLRYCGLEDAMSTINQQTKLIATWLNNVTRRNELTNLSDRILQDIGLSRGYTSVEACKPFWMA